MPDTHRLVIDSCMLQSEELRRFLNSSETNFAVLPEFIWHELYKQASVDAILEVFSVLADFPEQLIALRSGKEIASLDPHISDITSSMERPDTGQSIREMVVALGDPGPNEPVVRAQLERLWAAAAHSRSEMLMGAEDILVSLPEMAEQMFTPQDLHIIRTNVRYTPTMFSSIFGATDQIYEVLSDSGVEFTSTESGKFRIRSYLYRYSLAIVIYLLWWIKKGSQSQSRLDRASNDIIDLSFGVYGTYYDGLLTADKRAAWMYQNLCLALHALGADVPPIRHIRA